jgi:hypothetical protein
MSVRKAIVEGLVAPDDGDLAPVLAQYLLSLQFSKRQTARYETLAYKAQEGKLTPKEQDELDAFLTMETFLIVLKSKARRSLSNRAPAA